MGSLPIGLVHCQITEKERSKSRRTACFNATPKLELQDPLLDPGGDLLSEILRWNGSTTFAQS
nr:unnamed protein product [Callosobruchus analis]